MSDDIKNLVRIKIGGMEQNQFERFVADLLPRIFSDYENLEPTYNSLGKTTKGKSDAYVYHAQTDSYTAIICTTQQTNLRTKIIDDINKLTSAKFASKIARVLLCVNTPIGDEIEEYMEASRQHNWKLNPLSLERLTTYVMSRDDLLYRYFHESKSINPAMASHIDKRFDCGAQMKIAREDIAYSTSAWIELIDFPSEKEWKAIESGEMEVEERYIQKVTDMTGISTVWLKHCQSDKYLYSIIYDSEIEEMKTKFADKYLDAYIAIEPKNMQIVLIIQISEFKYDILLLGYDFAFWSWFDDHHKIPRVCELLKKIKQKFSPTGLIMTETQMRDLTISCDLHPSSILKEAESSRYWLDDLFDNWMDHIHNGYDEWFKKLYQECHR